MSKQRSGERGDSLAEFALVLPVLLLILIAILDFGRAIYAYSVVAHSAREGARRGIILANDSNISPADEADIIAVAENAAVGLDRSQLQVTVPAPAEEETVEVLVRYTFDLVTPLIAEALGRTSLMLQSRATMYTGY
jgi:Flp pilus assembly protein TadG